MDRREIERRLEQVEAYRASGQKAKAWAEANGLPLPTLTIWCAHARRWQARLDGVQVAAAPKPRGFVAACVAPSVMSTSVRVELTAGVARFELHWPLGHTRELAALLKEFGQ